MAKEATKTNNNPAVAEPEKELPIQLRRQLEEAEQIRAGMGDEPAPETPPEPGTPQAQPEPGAAPPAAAPAAPPAAQPETAEQQLRSALGRLEQAQRTNTQLNDRLNQLERSIASMQAQGAPPPEQRPDAAVPRVKPKLVTPEEEQDFGEDLLNVVGKRAREEYAPEFEDLAERLKRLEGRVEGVTTITDRSQKAQLYDTLGSQIPNWKDVNRSDDFKAWLAMPDTFSGRRRLDMLQEAFSRHEAGRVVAFFRGFLTEATGLPQTPPSPGSSAPPLATPANGHGNGSGKPSLEDYAAPGRARSAPQELPPDKPIYTNAWIAKFMADKRTGKYRGREADADAIERDIYQAQHEGRIQP
jgi:hypothetical protein